MNEQKIISTLIKSREAFEAINDYLDDGDFSAESVLIIHHIRDYYSNDDSASSVDLDILLGRLRRAIPNPKHFDVLSTVLNNLPEASPPNITKEVLEAKKHATGLKLAGALTSGRESRQLNELLDLYNRLRDAKDLTEKQALEEVVGLDLVKLAAKDFNTDNLIKLRPKTLNDRLDGGAKPGHHILIFAPTEMGKTLLSLDIVAGLIEDGYRVLYLGNEDPAADLLMRLGTRLTGLNKHQILANPEAAMQRMERLNIDNFVMVEASPGNFNLVKRMVKKHKPQVVVLDQLRNMDVRAEGRTQQLERAATEARNLAKGQGVLVISVTQAADSASGKRVLNRGDVDGSNVGIPGQCDVMIGIGATEEEELNLIRTISLPKNKLGGNHVHFTVTFDTEHNKVIDHSHAA